MELYSYKHTKILIQSPVNVRKFCFPHFQCLCGSFESKLLCYSISVKLDFVKKHLGVVYHRGVIDCTTGMVR